MSRTRQHTHGGRRAGAGRPQGARDGGPRAPGSGGLRAGAGRPRGSRNRVRRPPTSPLTIAAAEALARDPTVTAAALTRELGAAAILRGEPAPTRAAVWAAMRRVRASTRTD